MIYTEKEQHAITVFLRKIQPPLMRSTAKDVHFNSLAQHQEAITWYEKPIAIDRSHGKSMHKSMYSKGLVLMDLGRHLDEIIWYERVLLYT
jgi:hypothetical protein